MELFGTAGIRGDVTETVTPELAIAVGRAVALTAETSPIVIGYDGRTTSQGLAAAIEAGITSGGGSVRRIGQVPTPALAYASRGRVGVMVTASHNPPTDNGIKLFVDGAEYDSQQESKIESFVEDQPDPVGWEQWGDVASEPVLETYRSAVVEYVTDQVGTIEELTVAIDCGNGMGSHATPQVLSALGAKPIALNANVDGSFPARESKPTPKSLAEFRAFVAESEAELGIAHDGDADRIVILDKDGEIVHEDTVLAILATHYTETTAVTDPVVVTTPNASGRIDEQVETAGGRAERTALGYLQDGLKRERTEGTAETGVVFAGEPWKHIHPGFGDWIDGVVSAGMIAVLVADAGGIEPLTDPITERPYRKANVRCPDEKKAAAMKQLETALPAAFDETSVETDHGVRLSFPEGDWILVRPSGTEPYIRLYAESERVDTLIEQAEEIVTAAINET